MMPRSKPGSTSIVFDAGHGEEVIPEEADISELRTLLRTNGFETVTLRTAITSAALKSHRVCVLGNPLNASFSQQETTAIGAFVRTGGGLLMVSGATIFGKGGDQARKTNLNAIAQRFGLSFSGKAIQNPPENASPDAVGPPDAFLATPATQHQLTEGVRHLQFVSGTAIAPATTSHTLFRAGDAPAAPAVVVADTFGSGRVLALGGSAPFFNAFIGSLDHRVFLVRAFRWLAGLPLAASRRRRDVVEPELALESAEALKEIRVRLDTFEKEVKEMKEAITATIDQLRRVLRLLQETK